MAEIGKGVSPGKLASNVQKRITRAQEKVRKPNITFICVYVHLYVKLLLKRGFVACYQMVKCQCSGTQFTVV